jgi:hypothetical protein
MHARILHEASPFGVLTHSARSAVAVSLRGVNGRVPALSTLAARPVSDSSNDPFPQEQSMHKRKLAALVTAAFAGLMLSSPSFSDASSNTEMKNQTDGTISPTLGASEGQSAESADKQAAVSKEDAAAAKADYEAAIQKCDALASGERGSCVQDAKDAQLLAMNKGGDGSPATSGAPESRIVGPQSAK